LRARSARTSIGRDLHGAHRLRTAIGTRSARRATPIGASPTAPYSPDAAGAGRRILKNVALDLLAASGRFRRDRAPRGSTRRPTT
jgi:aminopeptidase N